MRRYIFSLLLLLMAVAAGAASRYPAMPDDKSDRARWMQEMQQHQNDFLAKELNLTDKQRADFIPVYNKMRAELFEAAQASRKKAKEVKDKGEAATDADYEAATKAYLDYRAKEADIVKSYYRNFSHILSKRQLYKLDSTERKFDRMLMKHRGNDSKQSNKKRAHSTKAASKKKSGQ